MNTLQMSLRIISMLLSTITDFVRTLESLVQYRQQAKPASAYQDLLSYTKRLISPLAPFIEVTERDTLEKIGEAFTFLIRKYKTFAEMTAALQDNTNSELTQMLAFLETFSETGERAAATTFEELEAVSVLRATTYFAARRAELEALQARMEKL